MRTGDDDYENWWWWLTELVMLIIRTGGDDYQCSMLKMVVNINVSTFVTRDHLLNRSFLKWRPSLFRCTVAGKIVKLSNNSLLCNAYGIIYVQQEKVQFMVIDIARLWIACIIGQVCSDSFNSGWSRKPWRLWVKNSREQLWRWVSHLVFLGQLLFFRGSFWL